MSKFAKVQGFDNLVRNLENRAIVNTNKTEFQAYIARYKKREQQNDEIRGVIKEINTLKQDIMEIKSLLIKGKVDGS